MNDPSKATTIGAQPQIVPFVSSHDVHIDTLRSVLGANLRVAMDTVFGKTLGGAAVLETAGYPITLDLLNEMRMPALSAYRQRKQTIRQGKQLHRETNFVIRYWMPRTRINNIGRSWPFLDMAYETIAKTLAGDAQLDIEMLNDDGDVQRYPSTDLMRLAGFRSVNELTIIGTYDFATSRDGKQGFAYPVLEVTFTATTRGAMGGFSYDCDRGLDGKPLPELEALCARLIDGQLDELCRLDGETPYVRLKALTDPPDPEVDCAPGGVVEPPPITNNIAINDDGDAMLAGPDVSIAWS